MNTWDTMDRLLVDCETFLDDVVSGRIQNGDQRVLHEFQQRVARMLGPVSLASLIKAWQEKHPRPIEAEAAKKGRRGK